MLTPDFVNGYGKRAEEIFNSFVSAAQTHDDFNSQLAKVVNCLLSGDYAQVKMHDRRFSRVSSQV